MFLTIFLILAIVLLLFALVECEERWFFATFGTISLIASIVFTLKFFQNIDKVNELKSLNVNMIPTAVIQRQIDFKKQKLDEVRSLIKQAFDKNKFQVDIRNIGAISVYAMPMSVINSTAGLGDIERGGAEKLKLLQSLIVTQNRIANDLIASESQLIRVDFYDRQAKIMQLEYSIIDGFWVRHLSIKNSTENEIVMNRDIKPN